MERGHSRAILTSDGVAVLWILDKRHVDPNEGSPICSHHLASYERHEAGKELKVLKLITKVELCRL